jgi:hypothetical protein
LGFELVVVEREVVLHLLVLLLQGVLLHQGILLRHHLILQGVVQCWCDVSWQSGVFV